MRTLELFSGTKSFSKVMQAHSHSTFMVDSSFEFHPDLCKDILSISAAELPHDIDILWASPPCTAFSVMQIGRNWNHDHTPKNDKARLGMDIVLKTISLIEDIKPKYWFMENPMGKLRKMPFMQSFTMHTITYCQYGDTRMKPTDIWTNADWFVPRPKCKNGDRCHDAAPRGTSQGTQKIKGAMNRGIIPPALFEDILLQYPTESR